jgi:hypothetical protein
MSIGRLAIVAALLLAGGCTSSANNGDSRLDWGSFVVISDEGSQYSVGSIEDMERVAGFPFVFPSYLPEGMDNKLELAAWVESTRSINGVVDKAGPGEQVIVYREDSNAPYITIQEQAPPLPHVYPDPDLGEETRVGESVIACRAFYAKDEFNPMFECQWPVGEKGFRVFFQWTVESPIPGHITGEMREEALKVVRSMIEDPYRP